MTKNEFERKYFDIDTKIRDLQKKRDDICREYCQDNEYTHLIGGKVEFCHKGKEKSPYPPFILKCFKPDKYGFINAIGHSVSKEGIESTRRVEYIMLSESYLREV